MKIKPNDAKEFWNKVDILLTSTTIPLSKICKEYEINYDTLLSSKMRVAYPSLLNTYKLASALGVQVEHLLSSDGLSVASENITGYNYTDQLYKLLDEESNLKRLVWRIAQCSAIQMRTIKDLLSSWGIGEYDTNGNSKAMASS